MMSLPSGCSNTSVALSRGTSSSVCCWLQLLLLWLAVLAPGLAQAISCQLAGDSYLNRAVQGQAVFRDASGRLTLEQVSSLAHPVDFLPLPDQLAINYTHDVVWLRFCLPASTHGDKPDWLRIAPPMLDDLTLYLPRGAGYESRQTGDRYPFSGRDWPYRLFAIVVPPDIDSTRPAYLRISTSSALNLRLDLWSETGFQRLVVHDSMFYGVLSGAVLLLVAFSLIAWWWLGDKLYLFYAINALAGGFFLLMNAGFGTQFLYPESGGMNDRLIAWFTGPILAVHILFFTYLFALRRHLPRLYPLMLVMAAMYVLLAPLSLVTDWRNIGIALQLQAFPVTVLWMFLVIYLGWKDPSRRIYMLAFLPWLIGLFANALLRLGTISENFLVSYSGETSSLIHIVILPILIVYRTRRAEFEKGKALARELRQARRMGRELEMRVQQRTAELRVEIKARGELQEKLQEALVVEQATLANQRQLVAMLSHEFRTPLAIIDVTAQSLGIKLEKIQPQLMLRIGKIRRAIKRLINLLENCLANERLNGSGSELRLEDVDIREYLAYNYGEQVLNGAHRIHLELPDGPIFLRCDRHLFGVALSNLVDNALKYSPEDRPVDIRLLDAVTSDMIVIEVQDQGAGVRQEDRERIFDQFFRSAGLSQTAGAGLGLHLARVLARRHGGDVALMPTRPGQGSLFALTVPKFEVLPSAFQMPPA